MNNIDRMTATQQQPRVDLPALGDIRRILIMKWSALGDIAVASAVMEDVRRAFPRAEIHLNTLPPWHRLFEDDPRFARIIAIPLRGEGLGNTLRWLREIRGNRYDAIIDLQSNDRSRALLTLLKLGGAKVRWLLGNQLRFPYNLGAPPLPQTIHAFTRQRGNIASGGIPAITPLPVFHIAPRNRSRVAELLRAHNLEGKRFAVFLPGCQAAGYLKRWGALRYGALAVYLHEAGYDNVALLGAGDEMEECQRIQALCGDWVVNLCGRTEVLDLIPICERAACIVANDTGTAHVTAAAGVPMAVYFGATDPRRARPIGDHVVTLQSEIYCINCYRKHCSHHSCMELVSPEAVFTALRGLGAV
jgi:heptosyltransferase-2